MAALFHLWVPTAARLRRDAVGGGYYRGRGIIRYGDHTVETAIHKWSRTISRVDKRRPEVGQRTRTDAGWFRGDLDRCESLIEPSFVKHHGSRDPPALYCSCNEPCHPAWKNLGACQQ